MKLGVVDDFPYVIISDNELYTAACTDCGANSATRGDKYIDPAVGFPKHIIQAHKRPKADTPNAFSQLLQLGLVRLEPLTQHDVDRVKRKEEPEQVTRKVYKPGGTTLAKRKREQMSAETADSHEDDTFPDDGDEIVAARIDVSTDRVVDVPAAQAKDARYRVNDDFIHVIKTEDGELHTAACKTCGANASLTAPGEPFFSVPGGFARHLTSKAHGIPNVPHSLAHMIREDLVILQPLSARDKERVQNKHEPLEVKKIGPWSCYKGWKQRKQAAVELGAVRSDADHTDEIPVAQLARKFLCRDLLP